MLKKAITYFLLFGVVLATSWSLIPAGFFRVHDFTHAARIAEMARGLEGGEFPVRWSQNFGYGYGMPLFEFYAPLPFYLGGVLYLAGVPLILTLKIIWLIPTLLTLIGAYVLGEKLFGRIGGIVLATTLTLAPYRAVNLFVRGALSEAWGMMAIPWMLFGWVKVVRGERSGWWYLVFGLVTLFLSHNLMTMLFAPFSLVFGGGLLLIEWWSAHGKSSQWRVWLERIVLAGSSYVLAAGLAAFYLIPALMEKDLTSVNRIFGGYFHYANHFLYVRQFFNPRWAYGGSAWGPHDDLSFFLGWGQLLGLGVWGAVMVYQALQWRSAQKSERLSLIKSTAMAGVIGLCLGLSLLMSLEKSAPIWSAIPILAMVQFPWRWLGVATVFVSLAVALGVSKVRPDWARYGMMLVIWLVTMGTSYHYFRPEAYLVDAPMGYANLTGDYYYTDAERIRHEMSKTLWDYVPVQMKLDEKGEMPVTEVVASAGGASQAALTVVENRPHVKEVKVTQPVATSGAVLDWSIADFPGWQVWVNGQLQRQPHERAPLGNIRVTLPAETETTVRAVFTSSPVRFWSDMLSAVSWGVLMLCVVWTVLFPHLKKNKTK
jgi:hypothetical protein